MRKAATSGGISDMNILFDHMLLQLQRLLMYQNWHPIERAQLSFYFKKLSSLSKQFQSFQLKDDDFLSKFLSDRTLNVLANNMIKYKNARRSVEFFKYNDPPDLTLVGDRLAFQVALIHNATNKDSSKAEEVDFLDFPSHFYFDKNRFEEAQVGLQVQGSILDIKFLFHCLLQEVNRLFTYPHWLLIERAQISFYYQKLRSFSSDLESFTIADEDYVHALANDKNLRVLVRRILYYKSSSTSIELLDFNDPPDLNSVGERLANQVALIYKTFQDSRKAVECNSQDFQSQFHFDKHKYLEEEVFVGSVMEVNKLLQQLVSNTKKQLEVISIVGMAGLGKTTLAKRLYNDPYVVSYFYVRAWVTCSQVYHKRDLLLSILRSVTKVADDICNMNENMLAYDLYCELKGRRYLIVIDDLWSNKAWDDLKRCFPDDKNGSKIFSSPAEEVKKN